MSPTSGFREWTVVYLKGLCMGTADSVPGVSGGTIALITGIYERLIGAVTAINPRQVKRVFGAVRPGRRAAAVTAFDEMDAAFLLVLGAGIATAVVTVTRVLDVAIDAVPVPTFGFFFGLIAASAVVLAKTVSLDTPGRVAAAVAGFLAAFVVSGSAAAGLGRSLPVVAVAGSVAVSAMILPGISGSLLLIILGLYEYMVGTLSAFVDALIDLLDGGEVAALLDSGATVVAFVGGAVVGLFTVAHAVQWALDRYPEATLAFLVSLIVGALRAPLEKANEKVMEPGVVWSERAVGVTNEWTPALVGVFVLAALVGAAAVFLLDRHAGVVETG